jgi:serine/threonine-protein kinase
MIGLSLSQGGLVLGVVDTLRHPEIPVGVALGQSPLAGQLALPGDTVHIVISGGPEERPVPDLIGIRADRARDVLDAAGFTFQETSGESDLPAGVIAEMDPRPGTSLALPAEVLLTVSLGPPLVEVPLLVGLPEEEARAIADSVGLVVGEVSERFRFGLDQGTVIEQQPAARQMVERGSEVRLVVGRRGTGDGGLDRDSESGGSAPRTEDLDPREGTRRQP